MRIERLVLESFGAYQGAGVDFAPGLNIFFGRNEQGKSTLINGLLLALLGAPAQAELRLRYQPLAGGRYAVSVSFRASDGREFLVERDLGPGGRERVAMRDGEEWLTGRRPEAAFKGLGLPALDLARATVVICGSEVVLAAKEGGRTVGRALSARVAGDEGAATGQVALRRLRERRVRLENKERRAVEKEIEDLRRDVAELAAAREIERRLASAFKTAQDELAAGRRMEAAYRPAIEALERLERARAAHAESLARHETAFADLRALREVEREIERLERELAPFAVHADGLSPEAGQRLHQLLGKRRARQEAAAQADAERERLRREAESLRAGRAMRAEAGFTPERFRELDRLDAAVGLAERNLAERREAFSVLERQESRPGPVLALIILLALAGLAVAFKVHPSGWAGLGAALAGGWWWLISRRSRRNKLRMAQIAMDQTAREIERARAVFFLNSGGREFQAWHEEYLAAQRVEDGLRELEARLEAVGARLEDEPGEAAELEAILAAAGAGGPEDYEERARAWTDGQARLEAARAARASLLRGREEAEVARIEAELARREAAAAAALDEATAQAAGLDPVTVARHRADLDALDLAELARRVDRAAAALEQHRESAYQRDPWEVETALALAERRLSGLARAAEAARLAIEVMSQAVAEVQGSLIPKIEAGASAIFARLTGGRYEGLHLASGIDQIEVEPIRAGQRLPGSILSSGTADQMYLALRLALAGELQGAEPLPFILDDPFLTFDRHRLRLALELLAVMARENQAILVTKDDALCEIAKDLCCIKYGEGTPACGINGLTPMRMAFPPI